jgi:hypothetical protein
MAAQPVRRHAALHMALTEQPCSDEDALTLVAKAQAVVDANMGLNAPGLLSDDFELAQSYRPSLNKAQYLKTYGEYGLEEALPGLFWNAHDYRVDK